MAISSLPPGIPTVHFLTLEYFLYLIDARKYFYIINMNYLVYFIYLKEHPLATKVGKKKEATVCHMKTELYIHACLGKINSGEIITFFFFFCF